MTRVCALFIGHKVVASLSDVALFLLPQAKQTKERTNETHDDRRASQLASQPSEPRLTW